VTGATGVLCVAGSARRPSRTAALADATAAQLAARGASCRVWDLADRPVLGAAVAGVRELATTREFVRAVAAADAVVLASPVYHNSCSGLLKCALDELGPQLRHKPVALVSCSSSSRSAQALDHLRLVARALGGLVIPAQVVSRAIDHAGRDAGHRVCDRAIIDRVAVVADELLWLARLIADARPPRASQARADRSLEPIP
jgi:FMN reductase